jgi:SpoIID/LytB domain protein
MTRALRLLIALSLAAAGLPNQPAMATDAAVEFTFVGSGWGHGVGFSQYGAYGQSIAHPGRSGEDIAAYYFTDAEPASLTDLALSDDHLTDGDDPLWVGLAQNVSVLEVRPVDNAVDLCIGETCSSSLAAQPGQVWTYETSGDGCAWFLDGSVVGAAGSCSASVRWPEGAGVRVRDLSHTPLICGSVAELSMCEYREGHLELRADPAGSGFHVVLAVGLDEYLYGLRELPDSWLTSSVNQAQAVVARSYAAVEYLSREKPSLRTASTAGLSATQQDLCWCHTYDDTRDQYYVGHDKAVGAPHWVDAVDATRGRVLTYEGEGWEWATEDGILQGFYSSASGGWTASNTVGFGSSVQYPYLLPVADPWALDPATGNPNIEWSVTFTSSQLAGLLGVDEVAEATLISAPPYPAVRFATLKAGVSGVVELEGSALRSTLGLKSPMVNSINGVGSANGDGPPTPVFNDIATSVHRGAIEAIAEAGITRGCTTSSFCVNEPVSRGQMASFIARALSLPASGGDHVTDDDSSVHEDNINRIYDAGIPIACATGGYCPGIDITREEMAVFLYRALDLGEVAASGSVDSGIGAIDVFEDDDGSLYEREINAIALAGITLGCTESSFCPGEPVSRGQMASFLVRAFGLSTGG